MDQMNDFEFDVDAAAVSKDFNGPQNVNALHHEFHSLLEDLEFTPRANSVRTVSSSSQSDNDDSDDEDTDVKFPYQRPNGFEGLEERLRKRLADGSLDSSIEVDATVQRTKEQIRSEKNTKSVDEFRDRFTRESIYTCLFCSKAFNSSEELMSHTASRHDFSKHSFRCKLCGSMYKYQKNLDAHLKKHQSKPEHECKECSMVFRSQQTLDNHIFRQHNNSIQQKDNDELDVCRICKQSFPVTTIKRHLYYCTNKDKIAKIRAEKKAQSVPPSPAFSAISCDSFASLQGSSLSPRVSAIDKSCSVCGQVFASRQSMVRHVGRKHPERVNDESVTATRYVSMASPTHQYACTECGKRVTTRAALTLHIERIHKKTAKHECTICHKTYPIPAELRKHINRVHNKDSTISEKDETYVDMQF